MLKSFKHFGIRKRSGEQTPKWKQERESMNKPKSLLHFDSNPQNLDQFRLFCLLAPIPIQLIIILLVEYSRSYISVYFYPTPFRFIVPFVFFPIFSSLDILTILLANEGIKHCFSQRLDCRGTKHFSYNLYTCNVKLRENLIF